MKCFSIDLDGTLLNSNHEISDENLRTLKELQEQGHCVILNTGRAYADVIKIQQLKTLEVPIFCINGSVLYSAKRELLYEATISISTYKNIYSILREMGVGILVYTNHGGFPSTLPSLHQKSKEELNALFDQFNYGIILKQNPLQIYKVIALAHHNQLAKMEQVKQVLRGKFSISMASSFPNNVEITSHEAHKGKALLRYQDMMNLTFDEIIAFGDGGNDLGQFEVATTSIAMANAPIAIQHKADLITKTNDEDGFTYAIRHLI